MPMLKVLSSHWQSAYCLSFYICDCVDCVCVRVDLCPTVDHDQGWRRWAGHQLISLLIVKDGTLADLTLGPDHKMTSTLATSLDWR